MRPQVLMNEQVGFWIEALTEHRPLRFKLVGMELQFSAVLVFCGAKDDNDYCCVLPSSRPAAHLTMFLSPYW